MTVQEALKGIVGSECSMNHVAVSDEESDEESETLVSFIDDLYSYSIPALL